MSINYDKYLEDSAERHLSQEGFETISEIILGNAEEMEKRIQTQHNLHGKVVNEIQSIWNDAQKYLGVEPPYQSKTLNEMSPSELVGYIQEMAKEFSHITISDREELFYHTSIVLGNMHELGLLKETQHLFVEIHTSNLEQQTKLMDNVYKCYENIHLEGLYIQGFGDESSIMVQPPALKTSMLCINQEMGVFGLKEIENFREKFSETTYLSLYNVGSTFKFPSHTQLTHLICTESGLREISKEILSNSELEYLNLSYNEIRIIPEGFQDLPLHKLYLNDNSIEDAANIPFNTLNELNISNNEIRELPRNMVYYVVTNHLFMDSDGIDISNNCLNLRSCDDETWKIAVACLGVEKTQQVFLEKQNPETPQHQITFLEKFTEKKEINQGIKL